jgi:hypothetical protein
MGMYTKWTSRKFIAAMSSLASAHFLVWFGHIADGVYSAVVIATIAAYITGNVAQKVVSKQPEQ